MHFNSHNSDDAALQTINKTKWELEKISFAAIMAVKYLNTMYYVCDGVGNVTSTLYC